MFDRQKPKRRWFQISLRTLLILVTLASCVFGWLGLKAKQAREQRSAVAKILELKGDVYYDYQHDGPYDPDFLRTPPPGPAWVRAIMGDEIFTSVTGVRFSDLPQNAIGDNQLSILAKLHKLQSVGLRNARISSAGLKHLRGLSYLQDLNLFNTDVGDAGLEHLQGLTNLRRLRLDNTLVTDAGLIHLHGLTQLRYLYLHRTQVTEAGAQELQRALPDLEIFR
jgi:hypothetical protein